MKTAVVTGATSGIGKAIAKKLAEDNYRLIVISRSQLKLERLKADLGLDDRLLSGYEMDFKSPIGTERLAAKIQQENPVIDLLIHCAGYLQSGDIEMTGPTALDQHFYVNVRTPYVFTHQFLPSLRQTGGQIVFINSSVSNQHGKPGLSAYIASKLALKGIADCLREEVNSQGIRVISVYPGSTATEMQAAIQKTSGRPYTPEKLLQPDDIADIVVHSLKLPATAEVTDISVRPFQKA